MPPSCWIVPDAPAGVGTAGARAALVGNPSDGYGGAVLAVALHEYGARATAQSGPELQIVPPSDLVRATVLRFAREHAPAAERTTIRWSTSIPRAVGLGGSSAIVIAVLRALCSLYAVALNRPALAELALAVEVEQLGIAAGPQDRVAQVYGGVMFMDFGRGAEGYEPLDPALLPPLLVAWRGDAGGLSGAVHAPLRERYEQGDSAVVNGMAELGRLAHRARAALLDGDRAAFAACVDGSFEQRRVMLALDHRHAQMVRRARECGAAANYAGSGGAIVAVCRDEAHRLAAAVELRRLGCDTVAAAL
jgi:glucuronokinase